MAIPFFKHTPVGKSTQAQPYTAAAHIRYISRKRNTHHVESDGMSAHYWGAQDFLKDREDTIRKNGRVCDKFIIALPNEMTVEQGVETVRSFGNKLCRWDEGEQRFLRGSYYFTLQDHGTKNFHCHFVYVDADRKNGARVLETSRMGSTEKIKGIWEDACNAHLQAYDIDASISFEDAAEKKRSLCAVVDVDPPEVEEPTPPMDIEKFSEELVLGALELDTNLNWLKSKREEIERLTEEATQAQEAAKAYADYAAKQDIKADIHRNAVDLASDDLEPLTRPDGSYKGFEFTLFGRKVVSPTRRKAKELQGEIELHKHYQKSARDTADQNLRDAERFAETARLRTEKALVVRRQLEEMQTVYGDPDQIVETEQLLKDGITYQLSHLTPDEICQLHEDGKLHPDQARRALELMGQEHYVSLIEQRENVDEIEH